MPSSQPSTTASRASEELNGGVEGDAKPGFSQYEMHDTFAAEEASSTRTWAQGDTSEGPSSPESLAARVNGSTRGTEFIDRDHRRGEPETCNQWHSQSVSTGHRDGGTETV